MQFTSSLDTASSPRGVEGRATPSGVFLTQRAHLVPVVPFLLYVTSTRYPDLLIATLRSRRERQSLAQIKVITSVRAVPPGFETSIKLAFARRSSPGLGTILATAIAQSQRAFKRVYRAASGSPPHFGA